jgi:cobalt-zinc-cadmium efflux system outer membrane protein
MLPRPSLRRISSLGLLLIAGCLYPVGEKIDLTVCDLTAQPRDLQPLTPADQAPPMPPAADPHVTPTSHHVEEQVNPPRPADPDKPDEPQGQKPAVPFMQRRLSIPPDLLPSGPLPQFRIPPLTKENEAKRIEIVNSVYKPLPPLGPEPEPAPGPQGRPLNLADLQRLALSNSPLIRQAASTVEAMRGAAIQAGLPPNPNVGYEGDTAGTTGGAAYQGGFIDQVIKTASKLQLARASATMDLLNAQLALRRAQSDLATKVRGGYFAVLVARENVRVYRALFQFTNALYTNHVLYVRAGGVPVAYFEPLALRVQAYQARDLLVQARNQYQGAWKQLASSMGLPGMPLTQLAGRIDIPVPVYHYEEILARVLKNHTDVGTADNTLTQARYNLRLAQVTPIPDVDVRLMLQKDYTGPPFALTHSVQVTVPLPIWNHNQGGIIQAEANLVQASEEPHRVRAALTSTLAEAFSRYSTYRVQLDDYRDRILPDQARYFEGVYTQFQVAPGGFTFGDLIQAQQSFATVIQTYVSTLGLMWQAVVDVADPLQTDDLFQIGGQPTSTHDVSAIPDLKDLPLLPCCHLCSPIPDPQYKGGDGSWPPAVPGKEERAMPPAHDGTPIEKKPVEKPEMAPKPLPLSSIPTQPIKSLGKGDAFDPHLLEPPPDLPTSVHRAPSG